MAGKRKRIINRPLSSHEHFGKITKGRIVYSTNNATGRILNEIRKADEALNY